MKTSDPLAERGLPQNLDAERFILGSILLDDERLPDCQGVLTVDDFAIEKHRLIYEAMNTVALAAHRVDRLTVANELMRSGRLEAVDGLSYLVSLDDGMPHISNLGGYIRIVRDKAILRRTIRIADQIRNQAILEAESAPELLGRAERMLADLGLEAAQESAFRRPVDVIMSRGGSQAYLNRDQQIGVPTGFPQLDELTCGIRPGQLWVLAASTSGGKSTFARQIALQAAQRSFPGALYTLEMSEDEVTDGLICTAGQINTQVIRRGMAFERDKSRRAMGVIADLPIYISDGAGLTIPRMHGQLRKLKAQAGIQYAIVDYLQLMSPTGRFSSRREEVGHLSRGLKLIAQDLKIGVIALSQLKRIEVPNGGKRRRPELSDLRETGDIENDANLVAMLHSEWQIQKMDEYPTELIVNKQRGGPIGTINFGFRKATGTFIEYEKESE